MLPVESAIPGVLAALQTGRNAVLVAPPGAGKTTRVPPALLRESWAAGGKIILLEPRRLAARAAAERMAAELGERVGETIGLRMRLQSLIGPATRIEVVTEGVFARMILSDPALEGIAAVIFDEYHERSLDADLGLALALDAQSGLREDLRLIAMSATLDGARVAQLMRDAPLIESAGRLFPIETHYLGRDPHRPLGPVVADAVLAALRADPGSILVFLPGAREIRRTETLLKERVRDPSVLVVPLHGTMDFAEQRRAIEPAPPGQRKIVLATSIAETSLTIEGVRIVVDGGQVRVPRYDPATGLTELATMRVSQAAAEQRRGRAGRTEPGVCYRLWAENEMRALAPFAAPEILEADLAPLALALAEWGVSDPARLRWLDPPPAAAFAEACALLRDLGGLDAEGRITTQGRALARLPLAPRLAHMLLAAAESDATALASKLAVLLTERGLGGADVDLRHRLAAFDADRSRRASDARRMAAGWCRLVWAKDAPSSSAATGVILALAYPDRIAQARSGRPGEFLLANGRGAILDAADAMAREPYLVVAELVGAAPRARIAAAAPIALAEIEADFATTIANVDDVRFDAATHSVRARRLRRLGALTLQEAPLARPDADAVLAALLDGIRALGLEALPWDAALRRWCDRVLFLRKFEGEEWPDLSPPALLASLDQWLGPYLAGKRALSEIGAGELTTALHNLLPHALQRRLAVAAPAEWIAPSSRGHAIDYAAEGGPTVSLRVQELFGLGAHPSIAGGRVPLTLELVSPAGRPVQITRDLPGFWRGSYQAVRAEMRGRYPKHPWPEDPLKALPTTRAKPRP